MKENFYILPKSIIIKDNNNNNEIHDFSNVTHRYKYIMNGKEIKQLCINCN